MSVKKTNLHKLLKLRKWESENIPLLTANVGSSVIEYLISRFINNEFPTIKEVVYELNNFSRAGINLQFKKLETLGLIEFVDGFVDRRNRRIRPTNKFLELLNIYSLQVNLILSSRKS